MFSFGRFGVRQFGGAGLMVDAPTTKLEISVAEEFSAAGLQCDRVERTAERLVSSGLLTAAPACTVRVLEASPPHVGLGSGTQLALAVARGLLAFAGVPAPAGIELATRLGRARRSAVGSYGFDHGGLIVEAGKHASDSNSPLVARVELPANWRFVLIVPRGTGGLSGAAEERAFDSLPPVPEEVTNQLCREALLELVPAARRGDFDRFSASVYRFGQRAGSCFAAAQHGSFASPDVERLVKAIRARGVEGVAQSSWGPTVAAVVSSDTDAQALEASLSRNEGGRGYDVLITRANHSGATVEA
jgi:beta-RFAP synthase